jgi:hypothetical protein
MVGGLTLAFLASVTVSAANTQKAADVVAVFDIELDDVAGVSAEQARRFSEYLDSVVNGTGLRTSPRAEVRAKIAEQQAESLKACFDESCQIEIGKALAAQKAIGAKWTRFVGACVLSVRLFDLRTEVAEFSATANATCDEVGLRAAIDHVGQMLRARYASKAQVTASREVIDFGGKVRNERPRERGYLVVRSKTSVVPGDTGDSGRYVVGTVYVDSSQPAGRTRGERGWSSPEPMVAGVHRVTVTYQEESWMPAQVDAEIRDGETTEVELVLQPRFGLLDVVTEPAGAQVSFGGRVAAMTPARGVRVVAGLTLIELLLDEYLPVRENVMVASGQQSRIERSLSPDFGALEVTSDPPGALILVDGQLAHGSTPVTLERQPPGRRKVEVRLDGYGPAQAWVEVQRAKTASLELRLEPFLGRLLVTSTLRSLDGESSDCRAEVTVSRAGRVVATKKTPAEFRELLAVSHEVESECQGVRARRVVEVKHNEDTRVEFVTDDTAVREQARLAELEVQRLAAEEERRSAERWDAVGYVFKRLVGNWYGHDNTILMWLSSVDLRSASNPNAPRAARRLTEWEVHDSDSVGWKLGAPLARLGIGALTAGALLIPLDLEGGVEVPLDDGSVRAFAASRIRMQWLEAVVRVGSDGSGTGALDLQGGLAVFDGNLISPFAHVGHRWIMSTNGLAAQGIYLAGGNRFSLDLSPTVSLGLPVEVAVPLRGGDARRLLVSIDVRWKCCSDHLR